MGSVWFTFRAESRTRLLALLGLALLLGLIGGVVLTAAAGARRTDTAYPRLLRESDAADLLVAPTQSGFHGYFGALAQLPQVASMAPTAFLDMTLPGTSPFSGMSVEANPNGAEGVTINRVRILSGRLFGTADPHEIMINQRLADQEHLRPGGILHLVGYPQKDGNPDVPHALQLAFRVTAIVAFDDEITSGTRDTAAPRVLLSPAFARTPQARSFNPAGGAGYVRLRPGADARAFAARATSALAERYQVGHVDVINLGTQFAATERGIRPRAVALAIFAALASLIALAIIVQLLSRQLILDSAEFPILRALGMTRARLATLSLARMAIVTAAGAVIAVGVAVAASPVMPIGPARLAEPSPGFEINLAILAAGFAAIAVLPLILVAPAAWRAASRMPGTLGVAEPAAPLRPSRLGPALRLAGSVPGRLGVRMAFEPGHGRTAVPVRSALVGTTVAVAAVVAAAVFGASLIGLVSTPHQYGQNWVQELDLQVAAVPGAVSTKLFSRLPGLTDYAGGNYGQLGIRGIVVPAIGLDQLRGDRFFTLLAGRPPAGPGETVLGSRTLATMHAQLGQTLPVVVNGRTRHMRIVGSAVFAAFSVGGSSATDLGTGAAVSASVLSKPNPRTCGGSVTCYNFFLLRYQPGTDLRAAAVHLERAVTRAGCPRGLCLVTTDQRPSDIQDYAGVRDTPLVLGAVLVVLAIGTLTHVLLTGVRRRRRDLAVLKTLGLLRSQILRLVSWQANALAAVALLLGLPLGVVAGRWAWALFAASSGVASNADVPVPLVLLAIPVTLLLATIIAAGPGWEAARVRPASVLWNE
jgi:ABC-type antimicrobial peptide transport system permease subunit